MHNVLKQSYAGRAHVLHEDLHGRAAWIRRYFRCHEPERIEAALAEPHIGKWIARIRLLSESMPVVITGSTTSHLAPVLLAVCGAQLRTMHVHRHPLNASAASYVGSWTTNWAAIADVSSDPSHWVLTPFDTAVQYTSVRARWETLGAFARIAYNWLERSAAAVEFSALSAGKVMHLNLDARRDVFESSVFLDQIGTIIECEPSVMASNIAQPRNAGWKRALEERPLDNAWREFFALPELVEFASSLNYDCSEVALEDAAKRYQLPPGMGSWLRHHTRYWQIRRSLAKQLRKRSWIPTANPVSGGVPPRSTMSALSEMVDHEGRWFRHRGAAKPNTRADKQE